MKKLYFIILIFIFFNNFIIYSSESKKQNDKKIEIIQKSKTKFIYSFQNKELNSREIFTQLKDVPEAYNAFKKAHQKYIGFGVMEGFGTALSYLSTPFLIYRKFLILTKIEFTKP